MLKNYIKVIMRNLLRHKGYSFINLLGLAAGMTCCILIMLYVQDEFSYDRYPDHPDRIYRLVTDLEAPERGALSTARTPPPWAPVLAKEFPEIEDYVRLKAPLVSWMVSYAPAEKRFHEKGFYFADQTVFEFFNFKLIRGNPATALQEPSTVVLTESMARKYFGNDDPMGKVLRIDNSYDFRVTGVMRGVPRDAHFQAGFFASFKTLQAKTVEPPPYGPNYGGDMRQWFPDLYTYFRLRPGASPEAFEQKLPAWIQKNYGEMLAGFSAEMRASLQPLTGIHLHSHREAELQANSDISYVYIFSSIALFILLIACINFMNLATARSAGRAREVGIRKVAGAYRSQLIKQFLGESMVMASLSLVLAVGLTYLLLPVFNTLSGKTLALTFGDYGIVAGLCGIALLVGAVAGSYPALFLSSFQPATVLKGSSKAGSAHALLRKALVVVQFSISIALIVGTGVVSDQMDYVRNKNLGFDKERVIEMTLGDVDQREIYDTYKALILQSPDVLAVSASDAVPGGLINPQGFQPEGAPSDEPVLMNNLFVDHDFIKTLGIELADGRDFSRDFPTDTLQAFIFNEAAIKRLGWEDAPLGKKVKMGNFKDGRVIGVVKDFHLKSLHTKIEPLLIQLVPPGGKGLFTRLSIRVAPGGNSRVIGFLERQWRVVYPNDPFAFSFLDKDFDNLYRTDKLRGQVFEAFSFLAIFIACLGLLGLASFTAEQRTKEIGIRKVLGASIPSVVRLLSKEFVRLVLLANVIAWPAAYLVMNGWLQDFAYRIDLSLWTFVLAGLLAVVIALLTVSYQAIKAALANPVEALQYE